MVDTANWLTKVMRKDYTIGLSPVGGGPDPDQNLYLNYGCGGELNYNGYCNPEVDKLLDRQLVEADQERRNQVVWEIERKLEEHRHRTLLLYDHRRARWYPRLQRLTS